MRIAAFIILLLTCVQPAAGQARVPVAARSVETAVGTAPLIAAAIGTTRGERTAIFAMVGGVVGGAAVGALIGVMSWKDGEKGRRPVTPLASP